MGGGAPDTTMSVECEARSRAARQAFLFAVVQADRPLAPSVRRSLQGVKSVAIGRSTKLSTSEDGDSISLLLPDARISSSHARLVREGGRWSIEDASSKNGTLLNGTRIRSAEVHDRDVIEAGHTFLCLSRRACGLHYSQGSSGFGAYARPRPGSRDARPFAR